MTLIRSISGIRGTLGGAPGDNLTPSDLVRFTAAFTVFLRAKSGKDRLSIVLGRDARISGPMVSHLVTGTLMGCGADVIDTGLATTPTVEMAVTAFGADGGIILTASHNPRQWNALKLLNARGEFLSAQDGEELLRIADLGSVTFADTDSLGGYRVDNSALDLHIDRILALPLVDVAAIRNAGFSVAVDAVNSVGGIAVPRLLASLGVRTVQQVHCEPTGEFAHNPEPLPEHLGDLSALVVRTKADVGFAVDPDVDRLAILNETGTPIGEEYTLVAVADYILQHSAGNTVSNLSSSMALSEVTERYGGTWQGSAVGEVNVVELMKLTHAVIGGEGNGGIIYPPLHYGRDALAGIALFLSHMARSGKRCSELRASYPDFYISKNKIELRTPAGLDQLLERLAARYADREITTIDGVRIQMDREWVHLRKSNTEPIIRIYAESDTPEKADLLARKILADFREILNEQ